MEKKLLVFQTDFTYKEGAVCSMYGVVKSVDRSLDITDGTHEIPQFDTWSASYRLQQSMKFWPKGTVFVSVVDPGVGTQRKACAARTKNGYYIVTPDNGSLTHVSRIFGIEEVREIDETVNRLKGYDTEGVSIFHGRDLFAYCAAKLASGIISFEEVGPKYNVEDIVLHNIQKPIYEHNTVRGNLEINDPNFGNIWSNIRTTEFKKAGFKAGETVHILIENREETLFDQKVLFSMSFGDTEKGSPILYNNELMNLSLAVNQGSFTKTYNIGYGPDVQIIINKVL
ncbi:MAG: DNA-directed RNA polymerase subunit delta [Spirochaetales bacterium]|nr:MAG: DNA-directed RNA polymerase subunit delta [Spirochaetales bacterium]